MLDAAAIFTATCRVASKHVALRTHQLDVYSKTSTIAKAVQSQTDRVTLTIKAATALAERFNGPGPQYSTQASKDDSTARESDISSKSDANDLSGNSRQKQGLAQDHFYDKSDKNTTREPPPDHDLEVKQEKAKAPPLPDGSILTHRAQGIGSEQNKEIFSEIPKTEPGGEILEEQIQSFDGSLQPTTSEEITIPEPRVPERLESAEKAEKLQRQAEKQIPSEAAKPPPLSALDPEAASSADVGSPQEVAQEQEVFYKPSSSSGQVLSALPRTKIPKRTEDTQQTEEDVQDDHINQEVFYSSRPKDAKKTLPEVQAVPEQEQLSDGAYSEIFHSPRVAKMLGGQSKKDTPSKGLELPGAKETPVKDTKAPQEKDQVSSSLRTAVQGRKNTSDQGTSVAAPQHTDEDDIHDLAADISKDASTVSPDSSEVSLKI